MAPRVSLFLALALCLASFDSASGAQLRQRTTTTPTSTITGSSQVGSVPFDEFPAVDDVSEMANLSHSVYQYKKWTDIERVCPDWNNQTTTYRPGTCHWYRHDKTLGTQVMIVSSSEKDYLAVVFAGTDDLLTTLLDVDLRAVPFGTKEFRGKTHNNASKIPVHLDCDDCKVHEGFNNAVFGNHVFDDIYVRVEALRAQYTRLFVTGHSLGAAGSMLTAVALALEFEKKTIDLPHPVTSINFGGPQVGDQGFQQYIHRHFLSHSNNTRYSKYLSIWRFVLGWDLVPRLPVGYEHIGHTVQMDHSECKDVITNCWMWPDYDNITKHALTYYHHYGNTTLRYAGVPSSWSSKPYLWVPGALSSHSIKKYCEYFYEWETRSAQTWIHDFVGVDDDPSNNSSDALIDDDSYAEPPDDDAASMMTFGESEGLLLNVERRLWNWIWR